MDHTPRLRSAFPSTPSSATRNKPAPSQPKDEAKSPATSNASVIPSDFVDAPSQRLYISLIYAALMSWRLYDYFSLRLNSGDSFLLFTKWVGIDTVFLYGLSGLRIPWLQWSSSTFTFLFIAHGLLTWVLMFQIPLPLFSWVGGLTKLVYDRELAISERRVRPAAILHNSSLILGKQIINILPEGSAMLNPDGRAFCVGGHPSTVQLPIQIRESLPVSVELVRIDFETNEREILVVPQKDVKKLRQGAYTKGESSRGGAPSTVHFIAKKPGWYHLHRVIDDSKLDVQILSSSAAVVDCPSGFVGTVGHHKCLRQLSDLEFVIKAIPPVQIQYSKTVNRDDQGHTTLTIHPDHPIPNTAINVGSDLSTPEISDASWGRRQVLRVPINESLESPGTWKYRLDVVRDALGNVANYSEDPQGEALWYGRNPEPLEETMLVHKKPQISFKGCTQQQAMKVEEGRSTLLQVATASNLDKDDTLKIWLKFTPMTDVGPEQEHSLGAEVKMISLRADDLSISVKEPGLYTMAAVSSHFCEGEVMEPSSCVVVNPPRPDVILQTEEIADKCAGNSVGMLAKLHLTGTPPFTVTYDVRKRGERPTRKSIEVNQMQKSLELKPQDTGYYTYEINGIKDSVYRNAISLQQKELIASVNVKAPALARFRQWKPREVCLGEKAIVEVELNGEAPFELDYEMVHRGKRSQHKLANIETNLASIATEPLTIGGDYTIALTSLVDKSRCKVTLDAETALSVSLQRPRGAFGTIDGQRRVYEREGTRVSLPVRFQGEGPWKIQYERVDDPTARKASVLLHNSNDVIPVTMQGTYKMTSIQDRICPGDVDEVGDSFTVNWLQRPEVTLADSPKTQSLVGHFLRDEICAGDEDLVSILFTGSPPFAYEYEQRLRPEHGSRSSTTKKFTSGLRTASIDLASSDAGLYEYKITRLSDSSYGFESGKLSPPVIRQRVHALPSAQFTEAGKTYRYCQSDQTGNDLIPIKLTGQPPFQLELEIKNHALSKTDIVSVADIDSTLHQLKLPQRLRNEGTYSIWIRRVQDSRCQKHLERGGQQVHVNIAELPSIQPSEEQVDYCVGDHISFKLQGSPPFNVIYTFEQKDRRAIVPNTQFRRIAEKPGEFVITSVSDQRSTENCRAQTQLRKVIHAMPSVRVSKGRISTVDIHEGGETEILFEFGGTPPFHFTFTRSTVPSRGKAAEVLETRNEISHDFTKSIRASAQGMYEVVSIRDKFCAFSKQNYQRGSSQRLLKDT